MKPPKCWHSCVTSGYPGSLNTRWWPAALARRVTWLRKLEKHKFLNTQKTDHLSTVGKNLDIRCYKLTVNWKALYQSSPQRRTRLTSARSQQHGACHTFSRTVGRKFASPRKKQLHFPKWEVTASSSRAGCSSWSLPPAEELWQELTHPQVKPCRWPPRYQLLKTGRSLAILTSLEVLFPGAKPQAVASSRQHKGTLGSKKNTKFPSCLQITTLSTASCTIQPVWTSFQHFTFNEF